MNKNLEEKVKLFTQPYREAKESGTVGELEGIGVIEGSVNVCPADLEDDHSSSVYSKVKEKMAKESEKIGGNYIFGIDYKIVDLGRHGFLVLGTGDAYKDKS